jgi:hypothetical protein
MRQGVAQAGGRAGVTRVPRSESTPYGAS